MSDIKRQDPMCWAGSVSDPGCKALQLQQRIAELEAAYATWNEEHNRNLAVIDRFAQQLAAARSALKKALTYMAGGIQSQTQSEVLNVVRETLALLKGNK